MMAIDENVEMEKDLLLLLDNVDHPVEAAVAADEAVDVDVDQYGLDYDIQSETQRSTPPLIIK